MSLIKIFRDPPPTGGVLLTSPFPAVTAHPIRPVILSPEEEQEACRNRLNAINDAIDKATDEAREIAHRIRSLEHLRRAEVAKLDTLIGPSLDKAVERASDEIAAAMEEYDLAAEGQTEVEKAA